MTSSDPTTDRVLAHDLETAVDRGQILAYYQPQISVLTGRVVAVEALSRWQHPRFGLLGPNTFVPIAEATGSIRAIGRFMIEEGCRRAAEWKRRGRPIEVAVNVSAVQLSTAFFEQLAQTITEAGVEPGGLTIEITESQMIDDRPAAAVELERIRRLGVGVSIDDFGSGHSTAEQLAGLPATELKIDQYIVREDSEAGQRMMEAIVGLVRLRGLRVVAEGVETLEQLNRVRRFRCDRAQGFFIAPPMPHDDLERFLSSHPVGA